VKKSEIFGGGGGITQASPLHFVPQKGDTYTCCLTNLQGPDARFVPCRNITNKKLKKNNHKQRIERAIGNLYGDGPGDPSPLLLLLLLLPLHTTLNTVLIGTYHLELHNVLSFHHIKKDI
jgi:hypothetical protein